MILILAYYADGSSPPDLVFVPDGEKQAEETALHIVKFSQDGKMLRLYRINSLASAPVELNLKLAPIVRDHHWLAVTDEASLLVT